jgi:hypothetical protein
MRKQVTVVAMTACDGVSKLVGKREQEIAEACKRLNELQCSLDRTTAKLSPTETSGHPQRGSYPNPRIPL